MLHNTSEKIILLLEYIRQQQSLVGTFESTRNIERKHTVFYSSLIAIALYESSCRYDTDFIVLPILSLLESQKSNSCSLNYWQRNSQESRTEPLPDDLDDTFSAFLAQLLHGRIINEQELVALVRLLVTAEVSAGGPYQTWCTPHSHSGSWEDIDPVVNAVILSFLKQVSINLPELERWVVQAVSCTTQSLYYTSPISFIYRIVQADLEHPNILLEHLLNTTPTTILEKSLFVTTLLRLGRPHKDFTAIILDLIQTPISDIKPYPFFVERVRDGVPEYSGCAAFTAAAIVEALALFEQATKKATTQEKPVPDQTLTTYPEVVAQAAAFCETHDPSIRTSLEHQVSLFSGIPMLPMLWWEHLSPSLQDIVPRESAVTLSVAHLLGTAGCTLLDDIIDQDASMDYIPTGTILSRKAFSLFLECAINAPFVIQTFDAMDNAQHWEQTNAHIPPKDGTIALPETFPDYADYSILAQKSQGLALGALLLVQQTDPLSVKHVRQWFHHYLIARQLNDDAHDWLPDLEKGFLNPVGTMVLQKYAASHSNTTISLSQEKQLLQETFWHDVLDDVAKRVREHLAGARSSMESCTFLTSTDFLEKLLSPLERSVQTALKERDDAKKFLEAYSMHE